jgi:hypothetical protein
VKPELPPDPKVSFGIKVRSRLIKEGFLLQTSCCGLWTLPQVEYMLEWAEETWDAALGKERESGPEAREMTENWYPILATAIRATTAAAIFATLTADQDEEADFLREAGFAPIASFNNPNTGHEITIWLLQPDPREVEEDEDNEED